mmetsp:Transcript_5331/g.11201  ORF Transcript_5331/g.11201 Transcript_5331/m.11201 type:complete len:113 (-) Transcript_5331:1841-2179(-)
MRSMNPEEEEVTKLENQEFVERYRQEHSAVESCRRGKCDTTQYLMSFDLLKETSALAFLGFSFLQDWTNLLLYIQCYFSIFILPKINDHRSTDNREQLARTRISVLLSTGSY